MKVGPDAYKDKKRFPNGPWCKERDFVVVRRQQTAENGDIVAALLDDEATVKVFRQRDGHTWLLPRNSNYEPILGDHATIMGKVVTVLRSV